jgi:hypothetical protein
VESHEGYCVGFLVRKHNHLAAVGAAAVGAGGDGVVSAGNVVVGQGVVVGIARPLEEKDRPWTLVVTRDGNMAMSVAREARRDE